MATISLLLQGTKQVKNIYIKLSIGRNNQFKRKTGYSINSDDWSEKKSEPKQRDVALKNLKAKLDKLKVDILEAFNCAVNENIIIDGNWLQSTIDRTNSNVSPSNEDVLVNYCQIYIERLPNKLRPNGSVLSKSTFKKFPTLKSRIIEFEKYSKKSYKLCDVDLVFGDRFAAYLKDIEGYSTNYIGKLIKNLKTVCNDAKRKGVDINPQLELIQAPTEKTEKITLTFEELDKIEHVSLKTDYIDNARNWLLIGCNTGQRVSDFLEFTKENLVVMKGKLMIELIQKKTKKRVYVPVNKQAKRILEKNKGAFPRKISDVKFNEYIKKVCKEAQLTSLVEGAKINPKTNRKEKGQYPKWQLVSSHICRRSYATNYYGIIDTYLLKEITAHSTEKQFLEYVGKPAEEAALMVAEIMAKLDDVD
ncbi:hypothetical protein E9993_04885 [Labilibacter sediminis]|nr:hypothetical protein E9993_04885 [Labilibacter sediminis]